MNFVKCGVYLQEITDKGVREEEIDVRDPAEKEREERLRKLPEFTTDPTYKSLAEQLAENDAPFPDAGADAASGKNPFGLSKVTAEDAEFFEELERETALRLKERSLEEEAELAVFRQSVSQLNQTPLLPGATETEPLIPDSPRPSVHDPQAGRKDASTTTVLQQHYAWPAPRILIRRKSAEDGRAQADSPQLLADSSSSRAARGATAAEVPCSHGPLNDTGLQLLKEYEDDMRVSGEDVSDDNGDSGGKTDNGDGVNCKDEASSTLTRTAAATTSLKRKASAPLPDAKRPREGPPRLSSPQVVKEDASHLSKRKTASRWD